MKKFLLLTLLTSTSWLSGSITPAPGTFALQAELLYFSPNIDQAGFAISSVNNLFNGEFYPNGKRHVLDPAYHPAFRLDGVYALCNGVSCLDFLFTYFNAGDSKSLSGPFLFDVIGYPGDGTQSPEDTPYTGRARLKQHIDYYAGDIIYNRQIFDCCPDGLTFLLGFHGIYLKADHRFKSDGFHIDEEEQRFDFNRIHRVSRFWGIGPEFGLDYSYQLPSFCRCPSGAFSLDANGRMGLLCSHTEATFSDLTNRTTPTSTALNDQPFWRVNPFADVKLALNYDCCICCVKTQFSLGYEFVWYSNAVDFILSYDVAYAGDTVDYYSDFSLQGPFASIGCSF